MSDSKYNMGKKTNFPGLPDGLAAMIEGLISPVPIVAQELELSGRRVLPISLTDWVAANVRLISILGQEKYLRIAARKIDEDYVAMFSDEAENKPTVDTEAWVGNNLRRMRDLGGPQQWLTWQLANGLGYVPRLDSKAIRAKVQQLQHEGLG
jgi:hypothetical protein